MKKYKMYVWLSVIAMALMGISSVGCDEAAESDLDSQASGATKGTPGSPGTPDSYVDTFTGGNNVGNWYLGGSTVSMPSGGNPGAYLRATEWVPAPITRTDGASLFTGDYTAEKVEGLGIDLALFYWQGAVYGNTIHLVLKNDSGTPSDPSDDKGIWFDTGESIPPADGSWNSFYVPVPYDSPGLPKGAIAYEAGYTYTSGKIADGIWKNVIQDVHQVGWSWGYPLTPSIFSWKTYGADNALIDFDK